jgi:hypothetical protein
MFKHHALYCHGLSLCYHTRDHRMNFRDIPSLLKFEQHARHHSDNEIIMDCYRRIREVLAAAPGPGRELSGGPPVEGLKAGCEAVEKSTRLLWACAAATDNVEPALWHYLPDYQASLDYFLGLDDLELMAVTHEHRLAWG